LWQVAKDDGKYRKGFCPVYPVNSLFHTAKIQNSEQLSTKVTFFYYLFGTYSLFSYICSLNVIFGTMKKMHFARQVFDLYYDGFRNMHLGKTLWTIILIKLFIIFAVLKVFFFPDFLKSHADGDEAGYVASQILNQ